MGLFTSAIGLGGNKSASAAGSFFGFFLLIGSSIGLWVNEGRSVNQMDALYEMQSNVVTLTDTNYHPEHDNKLILIQGEAKALAEVKDPIFDISSNELALKRKVEMFQWKQKTSSKSKSETSYSYAKEWSSQTINSSSFKYPDDHYNPPMPYQTETFSSETKIGDYSLSKKVLARIALSKPMDLSALPAIVGEASNHKSYLFIGKNAKNPETGDVKITYTTAPSGDYSFIAKTQNKSLVNYTTENDKSLSFVRNGTVSAKDIIKSELSQNTTLTWVFRFVGLFAMFLGFLAALGFITSITSSIPILGGMVNGVAGIIAAVFTLTIGSIIIAVAWFSARPLLSLSILVIGILIAFLLKKFGGKKADSINVSGSSTPPPRKKTTPPNR